MMKLVKTSWFLFPLVALALHFGPGQRFLARDDAAARIAAGDRAAGELDWRAAADHYASAQALLPEEDEDARLRLALEEARALVRAGELIAGQEKLEGLLASLEAAGDQRSRLAQTSRHELATASYHAAWLMRLEGAAPDEWKPETERARQHFRLLGERAEERDDGPAALDAKRNLEATIRLEHMSLEDLLARPLPKDCPSCDGLSQKKRKQCQSRSKGKGKGEDAREEIKDAQGAGLNRREGSGS